MRKPLISFSTLACLAFILLCCNAVVNAQDAQDNPPRIEIGAMLSTARQTYGNYYHAGGGGRVTINVTRYLAGEVESTRQPTGNEPYIPPEVHTALAVKGTYHAEERRWLRFAGLNFFGLAGPAFINRSVYVAGALPPPALCFRCVVLQRETASMLEWGGGFEVVPARAVAVRFDVTHASFSEVPPYSSFPLTETRTYLKVAVVLRMW